MLLLFVWLVDGNQLLLCVILYFILTNRCYNWLFCWFLLETNCYLFLCLSFMMLCYPNWLRDRCHGLCVIILVKWLMPLSPDQMLLVIYWLTFFHCYFISFINILYHYLFYQQMLLLFIILVLNRKVSLFISFISWCFITMLLQVLL